MLLIQYIRFMIKYWSRRAKEKYPIIANAVVYCIVYHVQGAQMDRFVSGIRGCVAKYLTRDWMPAFFNFVKK